MNRPACPSSNQCIPPHFTARKCVRQCRPVTVLGKRLRAVCTAFPLL